MNSDQAGHGWTWRILEELGLVSVYNSSGDFKLLCLQRFVRFIAYGASTLILVLYLEALAITKTRIGLFMTLTMVGDVVISFFLTLFADAIGRKAVLGLGAALMVASGVVFALSGNYWVLLAAAIFGVISPSGNEIGPFRAIEESIVAQLTVPEIRSDIYAWYSLTGKVGTAIGMGVCGWVLHHLTEVLGWDHVRSYRLIFYAYAVLGFAKLVLVLLLSRSVESERKQKDSMPRNGNSETTPLLNGMPDLDVATEPEPEPEPEGRLRRLIPRISKESVPVVIELCLLFSLDSLASGLVTLSWVTYYFHQKFNISEGQLGSIFFITSFVSAASMILASSIAKRFGNVKTMVFTHLPSSIFLALIPITSDVHWSLAFLILRSSLAFMDTAPRAAFVAAIILPEERTAVMGTVGVVKTAAQSLGPVLTGFLADKDCLWVAFVVAGSLKVLYDLGILAVFETKEQDRAKAEQRRIEGQRESSEDRHEQE